MSKTFFISTKLLTTHLARTEEDKLIENILVLWEESVSRAVEITKPNDRDEGFFVRTNGPNGISTIFVEEVLNFTGYYHFVIEYHYYKIDLTSIKNEYFIEKFRELFVLTKVLCIKQDLTKKEEAKQRAIVQVKKDLERIRNGK